MPKRKKLEVPELGINPFITPLVVPVTKVVVKDTTYLVDRRGSTRIYQSATTRDLLCSLSGMAAKLVLFLTQTLEAGNDYLKIDVDAFKELCNVKSAKSFYNAINELHDKGIINPIRGKRGHYWINPAILFCGSAAKAFPNNIEIRQTWKKQG